MKSRLRFFVWVARIAGAFVLAIGIYNPVLAVEFPDLVVTKSHSGDFAQADVNRTYTITVANTGGVSTDGTLITVTDTLPTGLVAVNLSSFDPAWTCPGDILVPSTPLTCTRTTALGATATSDITLTVDVNVDAGVGPIIDEDPIFLRTVTNTVTVSGGGDQDGTGGNNVDTDVTRIIQKPDLVITGYELRNDANNAVITTPQDKQSFWVRMTVKNRGGLATGIFYPGVFLDGKPNYGLDHDPLGQITGFADYKISPAGSLNFPKGCLYYDPAGTINPLTQEVIPERGNYTRSQFNPSLDAGATTTLDVHIAYPVDEFPQAIYNTIRTGLSAGAYQIYLYVDPNCSGGDVESFEDNNSYGPIQLNIGSQIDVTIGGENRGSYLLPSGSSQRVNYVGLDSGPVRVESSNGVNIISAIRDAWQVNGVTTSFSQLMGLPSSQVSDKYVFPAYNNVTLNEQLRIGNVDANNPSTVVVTIGGIVRGTYTLQPNQAVRINYAGLDSGPVIVDGTDGVDIIAAIREAWAVNGVTKSFVQLMGLPAIQLSDKYVFPAYNNVTLNEQLRIGNVDIVPSTVKVTIGGVLRGTYTLMPNAAVRINYAGLDSGPVIVDGTDGVDIISAIRDAWMVNGVTTSFSQLMGMPSGQLSDQYLFPAYNNVTLNEQLRIGNVDTVPTTVVVTIGGVVRGSYDLDPNEAVRVNYAGLDSGPVVVKGTTGVNIISAIREAWAVNGVTQSFVQLMGLPSSQLSPAYLFPAYNNVTLNEQLRFGVP